MKGETETMKKKLVLGMAGVMAFTTLLGTNVVIGNADEDKVEITYTSRGNADEIKVYQQAVDAFNEAQDKIHVTFEASPSDGYSQQLITQLAGGTAARRHLRRGYGYEPAGEKRNHR